MKNKTCFKCGETKKVSEFYRHPQMGDGLLGKCKCCTKRDTAERALRLSMDPAWAIRERERHRQKAARQRRENKALKPSLETRRKWHSSNRHKKRASNLVSNAIRSGKLKKLPCVVCGRRDSQGHHEDYSKPLDVIWLCPKHHGEHHSKKRDNEILARLTK